MLKKEPIGSIRARLWSRIYQKFRKCNQSVTEPSTEESSTRSSEFEYDSDADEPVVCLNGHP